MYPHSRQSFYVALLGLGFALFGTPAVGRGEDVRITVVAILGTDRNDTVDCELDCIAKEIQKKLPRLTGFHLEKVTCESLTVGKKQSFKLVEDAEATVEVRHGADQDNRVGLAVRAPRQGEIAYKTCCGKFFVIVTRYETKAQDRLILAIRVQPCKNDKKVDEH